MVSGTEHQNSFEKCGFLIWKNLEESILNNRDSFEKSCCILKFFVTRSSNINIVRCASFQRSQIILPSAFFFLLTKEIDDAAQNLKLDYFLAFCSENCSGSVTLC